jgi:hypothetical protein
LRAAAPEPDPDYVDAFEATSRDGTERTAAQWARDALEAAPPLVRWFVVFGWRFVLGLHLDPRPAADHVLGWRVVPVSSHAMFLEAHSALLDVRLLFLIDGPRVCWMTFIHHRNWLSRLVWVPVGVLHRRIVPYVITRAARSTPRAA